MFFSGGGLKLPIPPRVKENRGKNSKEKEEQQQRVWLWMSQLYFLLVSNAGCYLAVEKQPLICYFPDNLLNV